MVACWLTAGHILRLIKLDDEHYLQFDNWVGGRTQGLLLRVLIVEKHLFLIRIFVLLQPITSEYETHISRHGIKAENCIPNQ